MAGAHWAVISQGYLPSHKTSAGARGAYLAARCSRLLADLVLVPLGHRGPTCSGRKIARDWGEFRWKDFSSLRKLLPKTSRNENNRNIHSKTDSDNEEV
ncbi:586_t:CDS:2, partial [Dentiscutata erythropus]